jgi:GMP synthase-like glutamine amidotransferase
LPDGATLLASSAYCPVAGYTVGEHIICVQAHPEFDLAFSRHLLDEHRPRMGDVQHAASVQALALGHEGQDMARVVVDFIEGSRRGG